MKSSRCYMFDHCRRFYCYDCWWAKCPEPFIIGGGEIYRLALDNNLVNRIYLTRVHKHYEGDTFFPEASSHP